MNRLGIARVWKLSDPNVWAMPDIYLNPLPWQERGLLYTATGYGHKIPSRYTLKLNGRMRRVYIACHSNCASSYVEVLGERYIVEMDEVTA